MVKSRQIGRLFNTELPIEKTNFMRHLRGIRVKYLHEILELMKLELIEGIELLERRKWDIPQFLDCKLKLRLVLELRHERRT